MESKKKECYHKNIQKITCTAGTWLIVSHIPNRYRL
mgnify:CR=1 FL=1